MRISPPRIRPAVVVLLTALVLTAGCGPTPTPPATESAGETADTPSGARTYVVRARVVRINSRARPVQIDIEHEAIPELIGPGGEVEGMHSMVMPFPVADGVALDGLAADDFIEIDLSIDWEADRPAVITAIRPLPASTQLNLG